MEREVERVKREVEAERWRDRYTQRELREVEGER